METLLKLKKKLIVLKDKHNDLWYDYGTAIYGDYKIGDRCRALDDKMNAIVDKAVKIAKRHNIKLPEKLPIYAHGGRCLRDCGLR